MKDNPGLGRWWFIKDSEKKIGKNSIKKKIVK